MARIRLLLLLVFQEKKNLITQTYLCKYIKALTELVGRLSLSIEWEKVPNGE